LLRIGVAQLHAAMHARELFPAAPELRDEVVAHVRATEELLSAEGRCRLEEYVEQDGRRRHLIVEFRRQPGDAAKRLLL
jgi:hypothetical protein